jgi:quercetin dioxygenase-like cupin family protein
MIRISKPGTVKKTDQMEDGTNASQTYILNPPDGGPHAFLVEMVPSSEVPPHFHKTSQFQVVIDGDGRLGRHDLGPKCVHYAQRHSTYGPIAAG